MIKVVSLIPNLRGEAGHIFEYNLSIERAAKANGWCFTAAIPDDAELTNLPKKWHKSLKSHDPAAGLKGLNKSLAQLRYAVSLFRFLRPILKEKNSKPVLFIESFQKSHIVAILYSLIFLPSSNLSLWILFRYSPHQYGSSSNAYRLLCRLFKKLLGKRFQLIADSELLTRSQSKFFGIDVNLVPVPHTDLESDGAFPKDDDKTVCWWPGPPREAKGLDVIKKLCGSTEGKLSELKLVLAKNAVTEKSGGSITVEEVSLSLTRQDYLKWLATSDIILMPYIPYEYMEGTSGIFIEAVCAGKLPLTTDGTWMAHELRRHNLEEFIFDWSMERFGERVLNLKNNLKAKEKLKVMRDNYLQFHNNGSFAQAMKKVLNKTA